MNDSTRGDPDHVAEIRRIREKLRYGATRLATPHEVATARRNAAL
jgi:hypothetical protein